MADEEGIRKPNTGKPEGDSGKPDAPRALPAQKEEGRKEPSRQESLKKEPEREEDEELEKSEIKERSSSQIPAALKVLSKLSVNAYLGLIFLLL